MAGSAKKSQSSLMRFVGNKNVVTILGIAACIAILVVGYAYRVNNSVATQSVPFARKSLEARSIISDGDVGNGNRVCLIILLLIFWELSLIKKDVVQANLSH